jgi:hypothetical protein
MNTGNGFFTAPFSGTFGFVFYGEFKCDSADRYLDIYHNGAKRNIYFCYGGSSSGYSSSSIYFAISLKLGDTVGIFSSSSYILISNHPAKFTGFLLQKN